MSAISSCVAVEIRTYVASRHDRFTGFPDAPAWNDSAYFESRKFTGVGWVVGESPARQFALVTPRHAVFANHYLPANGTVIRFLNANGVTVDRTVANSTTVLSTAGAATDLALITLSSALTSGDGVTPFAYLNLASDNAYRNTVLTIFGWHAKAGRGTISAIENFSEPGIGETRAMRFNFRKSSGNADDAHVVLYDSGSPTFAMAGEVPALVGVHLAAGESDLVYTNYDTFVPFYVAQLNELLAPEGYQMSPAYPSPVTMELTGETTPKILRQAEAGTCQFDLKNSGTVVAGNAKLVLHFQAGEGPASLAAPDWVFDQSGPDTWELHRATLGTGVTSSVTASWTKLPSQAALLVEVIHSSDGSPKQTQTFDLEPMPSYAAWVDGVMEQGEMDDPDGDGIANLLEYAFGGDPAVGSSQSVSGGILLPVPSVENEQIVVRLPIREDMALRGLSYIVEFSETLETGNWSTVPPEGYTVTDSAFEPAVSGFQLRTIQFDRNTPRRFCRVRIELEEPTE